MEQSQSGIEELIARLRPVRLKRKCPMTTPNFRAFVEYVAKMSIQLQNKALERALRQLVILGISPEDITVRYVGNERRGDIQVREVPLFTFQGSETINGYEISVLPIEAPKKDILSV